MSDCLRVLVGDEVIATVPINRTVSEGTAAAFALLAFERWVAEVSIVWEVRRDGEVVQQGEAKRK